MLQAVAENNGIPNSEPKVGLAQNVMDLAISPKLTNLEEMLLLNLSAEGAHGGRGVRPQDNLFERARLCLHRIYFHDNMKVDLHQ